MQTPGMVSLLGSGETSTTGGQVFEALSRQLLTQFPEPLKISILETPAGFEVNAQRVAGRVADFLKVRLQNYKPEISLVAARKKGSPYSPDAEDIVQPLFDSQLIFFGPGSPTYTIRQMKDSLAWQILQARQRLGASLVLASAAIIALSKFALPVYEIYKVGEDVHWKEGLDFFQPYGLSLAIIPHWNNNEGGEEVDTSRCFMGKDRFSQLREILPPHVTILGIDEHTALTIDFDSQSCLVRGLGEVHIIRGGEQQDCSAGCSYSIFDLGNFHPLSDPSVGLPGAIWERALTAHLADENRLDETAPLEAPVEVRRLVEERQEAREAKDWARADHLRGRIASLGWQVKDTPEGPELEQAK